MNLVKEFALHDWRAILEYKNSLMKKGWVFEKIFLLTAEGHKELWQNPKTGNSVVIVLLDK
jgi:hypothetical protein